MDNAEDDAENRLAGSSDCDVDDATEVENGVESAENLLEGSSSTKCVFVVASEKIGSSNGF